MLHSWFVWFSWICYTLAFIIYCHVFLQELFSKQKGFLEEELDYRKQALDQAYMVWSLEQYDLHLYKTVGLLNRQNLFCQFGRHLQHLYFNCKFNLGCVQGKMVQEYSDATLSFQHDTKTFGISLKTSWMKHAPWRKFVTLSWDTASFTTEVQILSRF